MNINKYYQALREVQRTSCDISKSFNKNKYLIALDMLVCAVKYGASPVNYEKFEFYNLKAEQRRTYVTHELSEKMIRSFNDNAYRDIFEDKIKFAAKFKKFFSRGWIFSKCTKEEFERFIKDKDKIIYKPLNSAQGQGIEVIKNPSMKDYDRLQQMQDAIVEEWIEQNEVLSDIYPNAVNCLRIITVCKSGIVNRLVGG